MEICGINFLEQRSSNLFPYVAQQREQCKEGNLAPFFFTKKDRRATAFRKNCIVWQNCYTGKNIFAYKSCHVK